MKVGDLVRYRHSESKDYGVIVDSNKPAEYTIYTIQWSDFVHPLVGRLKFLRSDSLEKVA